MKNNVISKAPPIIEIQNSNTDSKVEMSLLSEAGGLFTYSFLYDSPQIHTPSSVLIKWKIPYIDGKGTWTVNGIHDKRLQYDWELEHMDSRVSVGAPVISVFGVQDTNIITFAVADPINLIEMNAMLREEDNQLYCHCRFFKESVPMDSYQTEIRIDLRDMPFHQSVKEVSNWWANKEALKPLDIPPLARAPLYSTWYNYHQSLEENRLLAELKTGKALGLDLVIIDDGWQTKDSNRGYDYTGDWEPERLTDMAGFISKIHELGVKAGLWFSVPFCGQKSRAYQRFKGKFLTEDHRWAPVFDPRYPEVREYLISTYVNAVKSWKLDALKLDFIDDFTVYEDTPQGAENGRDIASVNEAVDLLMTGVIKGVREVKPEMVIEFRQKYVGPAMRKYGHMFRAFDCPNDPITNRIRTTDLKLLCGSTIVHSDPITWHPADSQENIALQLLNALFAVPQISVELNELPDDQMNTLRFMLDYWRQYAQILLHGTFTPENPLGNYSILRSEKEGHEIVGVYDKVWINLLKRNRIDIFNASDESRIILSCREDMGTASIQIKNCQGHAIVKIEKKLSLGIHAFEVPVGGHIQLTTIH